MQQDLPGQLLVLGTQLPLEHVEQLLDRISPRRVLRQEEEVDPKPLSNDLHLLLLMDSCIVNNNNDLPVGGGGLRAQLRGNLEHKVFEESGIITTLDHLQANDLVLRHGCGQAHRVLSDWLGLALVVQHNHLFLNTESRYTFLLRLLQAVEGLLGHRQVRLHIDTMT